MCLALKDVPSTQVRPVCCRCVGCENIHTVQCSTIHKTLGHPTHTLRDGIDSMCRV